MSFNSDSVLGRLFTCYLPWLMLGGLLPFAFAPFDLTWLPYLIFAAACLLLPALARLSFRRVAAAGWWMGFGFFSVGVFWVYYSIHDYGNASALLAGSLTLLFTGLLALFFVMQFSLLGFLLRYTRRPAPQAIDACGRMLVDGLLFAAVWVLFEWVRAWFLTGFPWLLIGEALPAGAMGSWLAGWAPVAGVYACSLLTILVGVVLACWISWLRGRFGSVQDNNESGQSSIWPAVAVTAVVAALADAGYWLNAVDWTSSKGPELAVAFVQPDIPQLTKWQPSARDAIIRDYIRSTDELWDADIVIWPETALPLFEHQAGDLLERLDARATQTNTAFFTGILTVSEDEDGEPAVHNSFIGLGDGAGRYDKQRLVPFGEYVPMQSLLRGFIEFFNMPMSDMKRGSPDQDSLTMTLSGSTGEETYRVAALICYEVVYPDFVAERAEDVDLMITVSNDTWFGKSIGPLQHLQIARMRALEQQKPFLRGTNNGVTAIIDYRGRIVDRLPQFERGVLRGMVQPREGATPFARSGSAPVLLLSAGLILALLWRSVWSCKPQCR